MTRVRGTAVAPGTFVYATLLPANVYYPDVADEVIDEAFAGTDGTWELNLLPTVSVTSVRYRIRIWQIGTFWVNVPEPPVDNTPVDLDDILIAPPTQPAPPPTPGPFVMRSELAQPGGVATLGSDGLLKLGQRPAGGGGPGGDPQEWFSGDGPPPLAIPGAIVGDIYIDRLTGDLYQLT